MTKLNILNIAYPTPGDDQFYTRWEKIGNTAVKDVSQVHVIVTDHRHLINDDLINKFTALRYIVTPNTAISHIQITKDIPILSLRGETNFLRTVHSVSEYVISQMFRIYREEHTPPRTLHGKTVGLIGGRGRIGTHLKDKLATLGCGVLLYDQIDSKSALEFLLRESDIVSIHLSENPTTRGFVTGKMISLMKKTAWLINTARPSVIDENALYESVWEKNIAGCVLDVTDMPKKFKELSNSIITDHVAGFTLDDRIRTDQYMVSKLLSRIRRDHLIKHRDTRGRDIAQVSGPGNTSQSDLNTGLSEISNGSQYQGVHGVGVCPENITSPVFERDGGHGCRAAIRREINFSDL